MPDPTSISDSEYARKRRHLFELTKDLRDMGADTELTIPRIAVIGGQSAGKSSLVEAVTGIKVPRDSGTCTKCPMECSITTTTQSWSCRISLRNSNPGPQGQSTRPFSPLLTSKDEVEIWIRRAQTAVLSPHKSQDDFLQSSYEELRELTRTDDAMKRFSADMVIVHIEDPDGTDLAFVDLPGLIQNADQDVIDLVRGLVQTHIREDSTIILVTVPATDDLDTQEAMRLARDVDPEGKRTIGVVSKPDAIPRGASGLRQSWLDIFHGRIEAYRLRWGYYSVRLPDDEQRKSNLSRQDTDRLALEFFQSGAPWKDIMHLNRLGIPNLIFDISKLLMRIIQDILPMHKEQIQQQLNTCAQELELLPKPLEFDPLTEIMDLITRFCTDLEELVDGRTHDKAFVHRCKAMFAWFKVAIWQTRPDFRPFPEFERYDMPLDPESDKDDTAIGISVDYANLSIDLPQPRGLYDVRRVIEESKAWELPHNVPYEAKTRLYEEFVDSWSDPAHACFEKIAQILLEVVNDEITVHFARFKVLEQHFGCIIRKEVERVKQLTLQSLQEVLTRESTPYFTQNYHYLESTRAKFLAHYKLIRYNQNRYIRGGSETQRSPSFDNFCEAPAQSEIAYSHHETKPATVRALEALSELGYSKLSTTDFARLHPPDQFEEELQVMADVRAYFQVSHKRIIDHIPVMIQHSLNRALVQGMQKCLLAELHLGTPDASERLRQLLVEDPDVEARRTELEAKRTRLLEIQRKLNNFQS